MTPTDHNTSPEAGFVVSMERYLRPDDDPDLQEYANIGDAWVVSEDRDE